MKVFFIFVRVRACACMCVCMRVLPIVIYFNSFILFNLRRFSFREWEHLTKEESFCFLLLLSSFTSRKSSASGKAELTLENRGFFFFLQVCRFSLTVASQRLCSESKFLHYEGRANTGRWGGNLSSNKEEIKKKKKRNWVSEKFWCLIL